MRRVTFLEACTYTARFTCDRKMKDDTQFLFMAILLERLNGNCQIKQAHTYPYIGHNFHCKRMELQDARHSGNEHL